MCIKFFFTFCIQIMYIPEFGNRLSIHFLYTEQEKKIIAFFEIVNIVSKLIQLSTQFNSSYASKIINHTTPICYWVVCNL